jgi:ADP-heptose:LPS heptosyltransferase
MGDVALTIPVLQAVVSQNQNIKITVLTRPTFASLFYLVPKLDIVTTDFEGKHKGWIGLFRLYQSLQNTKKFDLIIDLHGVFRTNILGFLFKISRKSVYSIDKGRNDKKRFTAKNHPPIHELRHTSQRYADVFRRAGIKADLESYKKTYLRLTPNLERFLQDKNPPFIGIAPFASHVTKQFPLDKMKKVIAQLVFQYPDCSIFIFGGGQREAELAKPLTDKFRGVFSVIGSFSLVEEIALMQQMEVMLTMDSSNMHLARLVGTTVVSVWGSTHPYLGFSAFQQSDKRLNIQISIKKLPCRPCSVFGNKPCHRGDFACMNQIEEKEIVKGIELGIRNFFN